jgi:hypothetical protein
MMDFLQYMNLGKNNLHSFQVQYRNIFREILEYLSQINFDSDNLKWRNLKLEFVKLGLEIKENIQPSSHF